MLFLHLEPSWCLRVLFHCLVLSKPHASDVPVQFGHFLTNFWHWLGRDFSICFCLLNKLLSFLDKIKHFPPQQDWFLRVVLTVLVAQNSVVYMEFSLVRVRCSPNTVRTRQKTTCLSTFIFIRTTRTVAHWSDCAGVSILAEKSENGWTFLSRK